MRPRLRSLDLFPVEVDGQSLICLRDPTGLTDRAAFLPKPGAVAALLLDGTRTVEEVAAELGRRAHTKVDVAQIDDLVAQLDECLFLENERLEAHRRAVIEEFRAAPARVASHAGSAYAAEPEALRAAISGWNQKIAAESAPATVKVERGAPGVLVSPHIDYHRGGLTYARAWRTLAKTPPDLVVVLGTDHNGTDWPFSLTRKSYRTPLGDVRTDGALVDEICARIPAQADGLFADELNHRAEHSIELQAVWLRALYGDDVPPVLPVLCGSLHRAVARRESPRADARVASFLDALAAATADRRVLVIAGADLAHVGPRFGDGPMQAPDRERVQGDDRRSLDAVCARDAEGFFSAVSAIGDKNRVCGLAPIYHALVLAGRDGNAGTLIDYEQCKADDGGTSFVSIAALSI